MINDSDLPVYRRLANALRERIESGRIQPRRPLPSENQLQQEFGVSRDTVRRAVALLSELGLVRTVAGRGTYVRAVDVTVVKTEPGMRIFSRRATESERSTLGLDEGAWVLVIERAGGELDVLPAESAEIRVGESGPGGE
ncbi:GntR family transcriptional regulator [Microbispora sp. CA-102843]|uniref:GntR family transcriptional regulator n=1 Tax=Microbispora sp. CA-102843 TaxID=3239952 RepID=UPI003D8FE1EF